MFGQRQARALSPSGAQAPEELQAQFDAYESEIAYLDHQLGLLFDALEERALLDNTLVVIASDHGQEFGEHDSFTHGNALYRQTLDVPLMLLFPSRLPSGPMVDEPMTLIDLPATILDLIDVDTVTYLPGNSLASAWSTPVISG